MSKAIRWGILGPGLIAKRFAADLVTVEGAVPAAVASRSHPRAEAFAREYGFARAYGSYEELARDPDVDVVYIATPHPFHLSQSLLCLDHGKAVVCEKPVTVNAGEFRQIQEKAAAADRFYLEGMWARFFPVMEQVRTWIGEGRIGEPRIVQADFGFRAPFDPADRLWDLTLAGGSLLDVGIYPLAFATMIFGTGCDDIKASGHLGETGVDEQTAVLLHYPGGELAIATSSFRSNTTRQAHVWGTEGQIQVLAALNNPSRAILDAGGRKEEIHRPFEGTGFRFEIVHTHDCLRQGLLESPIMPLHDSLRLQEIMDEARRQIGLVYPMD